MSPAHSNYWMLDAVAAPPGQFLGWQIGTASGVYLKPPNGDITLDPLPGKANFINDCLANCFVCPVAVAAGANGGLFVMDAATDRITILDLSAKRTRRITSLGGTGAGLRHFNTPRSLTVLPSGSIAVADTGNRRVQLFSGPPYALLHVWGGPDLNLKPCAVASDHCGIIYIADRESRAVLRVRATGEWLDPLGPGMLHDPVAVAVAADQTVAVVDGRGVKGTIVIFPPDGSKPMHPPRVTAPLCLTFDTGGNLYAGTASAVVAKIQSDETQLSGWSLGGEGVSDTDGAITGLAWLEGQGLIGILSSRTPGVAPKLFSMDPAGVYRLAGSFLTNSLDSQIERCSWHRIQVIGCVPDTTTVSVSTRTSEDNNVNHWTPWSALTALTGDNLDCLVQSPPGRYLQITFGLQSAGTYTPQIHAIKVFFPRQSYLQYLPAVFQDDDESRVFLDRFLSIFQTTFDDFDTTLDNLWQIFDPNTTPANVLPWLSAWLALPVDSSTTASQQRQLLKNAFKNYLVRGTVAGLEHVIHAYTGVHKIRILEHFKLRDWTFLPLPAGPQSRRALVESKLLCAPAGRRRLDGGIVPVDKHARSLFGSLYLGREPVHCIVSCKSLYVFRDHGRHRDSSRS